MLWIIILILNVHNIQAGYKGTSITCECTTTHCLETHTKHCNTTSMCFSQYLDRHDGSHPVVRGCIKSKTPLLCENRRPAIAKGPWPLLLCCNSNLCNRDVVPTPPPWFAENDTSVVEDLRTLDVLESLTNNDTSANHLPHDTPHLPSPTSKKKPSRLSSLPHIISPVYISVLVLGLISLVVIGVVAAVVLRRSNRFYVEQYGALEHQHCLKHGAVTTPRMQCDCDSEFESLSQCSQPYIQVVYPSRVSNDT